MLELWFGDTNATVLVNEFPAAFWFGKTASL